MEEDNYITDKIHFFILIDRDMKQVKLQIEPSQSSNKFI